MKPVLSIVTPTYNRAQLLGRCYESLLNQTNFDFEWIVVDDGSSDNTEEVVKSFDTDKFTINYVKKANGGKHTALNAAHEHINGDYVLILDSDDYLTETAVEKVKTQWERWNDSSEVGMLVFYRGKDENTPLCIAADTNAPVDIMRYRRTTVFSSDCCEVIRAELFIEYPFPVYDGERFVSECALWNRVSFTHKCVYINDVIYICEYLAGGLTDSGRAMRIRNPLGGMFICDIRMDKKNYFKQRVKYGLLYTCYGFFAKLKPRQMVKKCRAKLLAYLCMPFGWTMYKLWKKKYM